MTDEVTLRRFRQLDEEGHSAAHIAHILGVSDRTIVRWRVRAGRTHGTCPTPRPASDKQQARELLDGGCSLGETARTIGVARKTIRQWFPDATGWTSKQGGEFRQMMSREWAMLGRVA